jgi:hypothetical protein
LGISPDDSISQIEIEQSDVSSTNSVANGEDKKDLEEEPLEDEVSGEAKVEEYLARQAELAVRLEDIEKARAIDNLHPDALFLTERIHMRSFEEIMPSRWTIDFPTLPVDLFTENPERQFINYNSLSSHSGTLYLIHSAAINLNIT